MERRKASLGRMGRLGLIAGSSFGGAALPDGRLGDARPPSRRLRRPMRCRTRSTTRRTCARSPRPGATGCWRSAPSAGSSRQLGPGDLRLPGRLHRPRRRAADRSRRRRPRTACPGSTPSGAAGPAARAPGRRARRCVDGGVYWQASGPRLETPGRGPADRRHADVIGMTIASECVVAGELGLALRGDLRRRQLRERGRRERELTIAELEAGRATRTSAMLRTRSRERFRRSG